MYNISVYIIQCFEEKVNKNRERQGVLMIDLVTRALFFCRDNIDMGVIADWAVIIGAVWAIILYKIQVKDKIKSAFTLIANEIEQIDDMVSKLIELNNDDKLNNIEVYNTTPILTYNHWEKNKHIIIKYLNKTDIKILDEFYYNAVQIERARKSLTDALDNNWYAKTLAVQNYIANFISNSLVNINEQELKKELEITNEFSNKITYIYNEIDRAFTPRVPVDILTKYLKLYKPIISSATYHTIVEKSFNTNSKKI